MAKSKTTKAKQAGLINEDGTPKPEATNRKGPPTAEVMRHHMQLVLARKAEHAQAVLDAAPAKANEKSALGAYRKAIKEAKKDGITPDSITSAIAIHTADHRQGKMQSEETRRLLAAIDSPMAVIYAHQQDLFDEAASAPAQAHDGGDTTNAVHAAGAKARREGVKRDNCPEDFGTVRATVWMQGWDEEDDFIRQGDANAGTTPKLGTSTATAGNA